MEKWDFKLTPLSKSRHQLVFQNQGKKFIFWQFFSSGRSLRLMNVYSPSSVFVLLDISLGQWSFIEWGARIIKLGAIWTDSIHYCHTGWFFKPGKKWPDHLWAIFLLRPVWGSWIFTLAKQGGTIYHERFANDRRCQKDWVEGKINGSWTSSFKRDAPEMPIGKTCMAQARVSSRFECQVGLSN